MRTLKPFLAVVLGMAAGALPAQLDRALAQETPPPAAAIPSAAPPDTVHIPPVGAQVAPATSLPEAVQLLERDTIKYLTDGNTKTVYTPYATSTVRFKLLNESDVKGLKVFGASPYRIGVKSYKNGQLNAVSGLESIDLSILKPGWNHVAAIGGMIAKEIEITLTPLPQSGAAGIAEIELWGKGAHINATAENVAVAVTPPQTIVVKPTDVVAGAEFALGGGEGASQSARFNFNAPLTAGQVRQAFLVYELSGLSHWSEAARSFNGAPAQGGHVRRANTQWTTQSEPVSPDLIASGANFVEFHAVSDGTVPYSVRNVRLVFDPSDGWNFIDRIDTNQAAASDLLDGNAATGWQVYPGNVAARAAEPTLVAELKGAVTVDRLRLNVSEPLSGTITIEERTAAGWIAAAAPLNASSLTPGFNDIALGKAVATAVRLRFTGGDGPAKISEMQVSGSPAGEADANPALALSYPDAGQYFGDMAYVRGFLRPHSNASGAARIVVAGKPANVDRGTFEISIAKSEMGLDADGAWSVNVDAVYPDGKLITRSVKFDQLIDALRNDSATGASLTTDVSANAAKLISIADAQLDITTQALGETTRILARDSRRGGFGPSRIRAW